jgi:hypothetical protein
MIKLFEKDRKNYENVTRGFIQGLYNNQSAKACRLCDKMATIAGTLQVNFITLESNRDLWVNITQVFKLDFFTQVSRLITLVSLFATTAISIDQLLKEPAIMQMLGMVIARMTPDYINQMQEAVLDNMISLLLLWTTAPGSSCYSLGVRAGTTVKKLLQVSFDQISDTNSNATANVTQLFDAQGIISDKLSEIDNEEYLY